MKQNHFIHLSFSEKLLMLIHFYLPFLNKVSCWKKRYEMTRLLSRGKKKLQRDMNIFRVVNRLNYIIMLLKQTGQLTQKSFWICNHSQKNVVNCDKYGISEDSCTSENEVNEQGICKVHLATKKY